MQRLLSFVALSAMITACGQTAPSDTEISEVLSESISGKGCATSALFKTFPIPKSKASSNSHITKPFVDIGFIAESAGEYQLTEKGQAAYDAGKSGFCYTNSYQISDIKVTGEETASDLPPALSRVWYVSFNVSPSNVDEWAKNPEIIKAASLASLENIVESKSFTVRVAKKKGEDDLIVADPTFSFSPGIHFNMGW